jgi:D-glycero-alpha-D-manno-heptose-7-phosphate kinase
MLITRTPLRISIGGGGTDLPSFYRQRDGYVISAAIDKYTFISLNRTFNDLYLIKYSELERQESVGNIGHRIVREVFTRHGIEPGVEMVSMADVPSGTGLGSSGTFTVGLLRAVYALKREHVTAGAIAEEAAEIEIEVLQEPVGKQDQYIAAFGGLTCFEFHPDDRVTVSPLSISQETLHTLEERLLLFFTGYTRSAGSVLADQRDRSDGGDQKMLDNLEQTKELGLRIRDALQAGDPSAFGQMMHEHWERKRNRSQGMSNENIDRWYDLAIGNGAIGGKLGEAMTEAGLQEMRFSFDLDGSVVIVRD